MKKHILSLYSSKYSWELSAIHEPKFFHAPKTCNYEVGDIVLLSPQGVWSNLVITSKEKITLRLPSVLECYDDSFDTIAMKISGLKGCYLSNKCRTEEQEVFFIEKNYSKIFNSLFGKKAFSMGEQGFKYGFKTVHEDVLNPKCYWTRVESSSSPFTTTCGHKFLGINSFKFCPHCGGELIEKPLFHIEVVDEYTKVLQEIKDDLNSDTEPDLHRFTHTLVFIEKMIENYSEKLGFSKEEIILALEKNRRYWSANYYQEANFPFLDENVWVFQSKKRLNELIDSTKGFRCGSCDGISEDSDKCTECGYKTYGLLKMSSDYRFVIKDEFLSVPVVHSILLPALFETKGDSDEK